MHNTCVYIYIYHTCITCVCVYICIERERERDVIHSLRRDPQCKLTGSGCSDFEQHERLDTQHISTSTTAIDTHGSVCTDNVSIALHEGCPDHQHRNLNTFEEHMKRLVMSRFSTE